MPLNFITECNNSWFHYGQCLYKKLVSFGLKAQYKNDPELRKLFKGFVALALLPVYKVIDGFDHLFENQQSKEYPQLENFLEYATETWLEDDALVHKSLWNHYDNKETMNMDLETIKY